MILVKLIKSPSSSELMSEPKNAKAIASGQDSLSKKTFYVPGFNVVA